MKKNICHFYDTLEAENIKMNHSLVPKQFYLKSYEEFYRQFNEYTLQNKIEKYLVLTDGRPKKSSLDNNIDIHEIFFKELKLETINLSQICNVAVDDIHASEFFLNKLTDILSAHQEDSVGYIALGSGTITDLLKHALYLMNKKDTKFISIPTATTVTAYTSAFSVVDINGAKRTRLSKSIDATFWIEPLLMAAPMALIKAGFGDLLARFVAYGDWYLGSKLEMFDNYDEIAMRLMEPFSPFLKCDLPCKKNYLLENMNLFAQTLAMAGVSMSLCNQTTPLSGYEHVISHGLDFLRLSSNRKMVLHGEQVALGVLSSATTFQWIIEQNEFDKKKFRSLNEKESSTLIKKLLTKAPFLEKSCDADIFLKDYLEKSERWKNAENNLNVFFNEWSIIRKKLQKLVISPHETEKILTFIDLPFTPESTNPTTTAMEYRWALRFAPFVRSRFCLGDFIFWIGEDPCACAAF